MRQGHTANAGFSQLTQTPFTSWLSLLGQTSPSLPVCPSAYSPSVGHWGPLGLPHLLGQALTLRSFMGPEQELGKLARKPPESGILAPSAH